MKGLFVLSLIIAVVAAGNWNSNEQNNRNLSVRDAKHQKFVLDLLRHLQNDIHQNDFMQYSNTIRLDNKNDYKDLNKVFHLVSLFQNGWFLQRNEPFSLMRERNIITTKALFDFFDTMNDWNTCAINLIWARRNINEYQFWHLMTLLVTHNRHFNNLVLPTFYEVFPNQFFTADVMDQAVNTNWNLNNNKVVIMQNYTTGVLGSNDNDDNDNVYDLNDIKHQNNKINDWNTLKMVMNDIKNQLRYNNQNNQFNNLKNKDIKSKVYNNNRNPNQGNKFDNNGEDRMVYFTEDIGLNNYYYFSRVGNSRILNNNQLYNNINNKDNFNMVNGQVVNNGETNDKITRRGERYVYQMKQLLARYNLERKSNGLDNVQSITLDGTVDNGVYPNLRYTNGLQMTNRQNDFDLKKQHNMKLIQVTKDFENRFYRAIDQGFVETVNGQKVNLQTDSGINILGNLLQGNQDSVNNQYYRYLEYYYRLLFGGNNNENVDFNDNRFVPTVLDHYETSMRDSVFWQILKRITGIVNKFQEKLTSYKTHEVDFNGVKVNNVKVDKMVTTFNYFDADITNGINHNLISKNMCGNNVNYNDNSGSDSNESSDSNSNENNFFNKNNGNNEFYYNNNGMNYNNNDQLWNKNYYNKKNVNFYGQNKNYNNYDSSDSSDSSDSNDSDSNEKNDDMKNFNYRNINRNNKNFNKMSKNYYNGNNYFNDMKYNNGKNFDNGKNFNNNGKKCNYKTGMNCQNNGLNFVNNGQNYKNNYNNGMNFNHGTSHQVNYWNRNGDNNYMNLNIIGRTRRMDTKQFTVTIDVTSNQNQHGIVRIFLGTRINNKQQLNDNRNNFVELDQFVVKLNQGNNLIKRNSLDFKNVVGDSETIGTLYHHTLNHLNNGGQNGGNNLNNINFDTNNNNQGFPHRLVLPKGTVEGEDYTLFVVISDLNNNNYNHVMYDNDLKTRGINNDVNNVNFDDVNNNDFNSNSNSDSNESNMINDSGSYEHNKNGFNGNYNGKQNVNKDYMNNQNNMNYNMHFNKNGNDYNNHHFGNVFNHNGKSIKGGNWLSKNYNGKFNGNFYGQNDNGVKIHNNNHGNKNIGNGNGVLDNRAMGFPLDRQIMDVNGFITNNMFFKDVTIFHVANNNQNYNQDNMINY